METVAVPLLGRLPRSQATGPRAVHVPEDGVAETRMPVDGRNAVRSTLDAEDGPLLVTVAV
jgi:hypothetical protein